MANHDNVTAMLKLAENDGTLDTCVIVGRDNDDRSGNLRIFTPSADKDAMITMLKRAIERLGG